MTWQDIDKSRAMLPFVKQKYFGPCFIMVSENMRWSHSAFQSTLNSSIVSYRIISYRTYSCNACVTFALARKRVGDDHDGDRSKKIWRKPNAENCSVGIQTHAYKQLQCISRYYKKSQNAINTVNFRVFKTETTSKSKRGNEFHVPVMFYGKMPCIRVLQIQR